MVRFHDYLMGKAPNPLLMADRAQQELLQQQQQQAQQSAQMQVMTQTKDPFSVDRYRHVSAPDVPMNYGGGIAETLLNDNEVPEEVRHAFWPVFHKDNTLTFLDPDRKQSKLLNFDIWKIDYLNTLPYYDYTFDKEMQWGILRNVFETKLDRALGHAGGANIKNERIILQSQFSEQRQISETGANNNFQGSFFKRLLGRR